MVRRWRRFGDFLRPAFPASRVQHVSDLHPKFATPCVEVWQTSNLRPLRLGEERKNKKELEMWANAQRDGPPAEYRWRPLFNAAKFG